MTSVLYDVPGPKALLRNRLLGVATVLLVLALFAFVIYRFAVTGQFDARRWSVFTYTAVWESIGKALLATLAAFAAAAVGALALSFILAMGRLSDHAWIRIPVTVITEFFRAVPVLVFMMLLYYGLPVAGVKMEPYWAVVIALVVYNGSVLAEALRAGVESLPRGQKEAGQALGLRKTGVMTLILLPQAVRAMLPVIIAQLVVTLKDTALGFVITYPELLYYAKQLMAHQTRPILQSVIVIGAIYIALCMLLSLIARIVEKRVSASPKLEGVNRPNAAVKDVLDTQLIAAQRGAGKSDMGNVTPPGV